MPCQWSARPLGVTPLRIARAMPASLQAPMPVSRSGVMFRVQSVPNGRQLIFAPPLPFGLWQSAHDATLYRYAPRATIACSSALSPDVSGDGRPAVDP